MACLIYTTWPDENSAEPMIETLLEERLIACANVLGPSQSVYRWESKITSSEETVVLFKTLSSKAEDVKDRIEALHPYEVPCILVLSVDNAASASRFINWMAEETGSSG